MDRTVPTTEDGIDTSRWTDIFEELSAMLADNYGPGRWVAAIYRGG